MLELVVNSLLLTAIIVRGDDDKMLKICDQLPVDMDITDVLDEGRIVFEEVVIPVVPEHYALTSPFSNYMNAFDASRGIILRPILDGVQRHDNDESVFAGTSIVATIVCSRDNKIIPKKGNANINNLATNSPVVVVLYLFFKDAMFIMFRMLKIHVVSYLETHVRCGSLQ